MGSYAVPVIYAMLQLVTYFFIGFMLRKGNIFSRYFFVQLSRFVVRVALPVYFFIRMSMMDVSNITDALVFPLAALILTALGFALSIPLLTLFKFEGTQKRAGIALSTFANTGFLPLFMVEVFPLTVPVIRDTFGTADPLLYIGVFSVVQSPLIWAIGSYLVSGSLKRPKFNEIFNPPIYGIILGLIFAALGFQPVLRNPLLPLYHVFTALEQLGLIVFPLVIVCLGAIIADFDRAAVRKGSKIITLAVIVSAVRLVIFPLLFIAAYFFLLRPSGLSPAHIWVIFLQMHIPPGTTLSIMAVQAKVNEANTSFVLLVTYILYLMVLPIYIMIFLSLPGVI